MNTIPWHKLPEAEQAYVLGKLQWNVNHAAEHRRAYVAAVEALGGTVARPSKAACTRCGVACSDHRQRDGERVCILCVEREGDAARTEAKRLRAALTRIRANVRAGVDPDTLERVCCEEILHGLGE